MSRKIPGASQTGSPAVCGGQSGLLTGDLPERLGKRRLAVRIVRAPHHVVDADDAAQGSADGVP
jgi:hypothetical protein